MIHVLVTIFLIWTTFAISNKIYCFIMKQFAIFGEKAIGYKRKSNFIVKFFNFLIVFRQIYDGLDIIAYDLKDSFSFNQFRYIRRNSTTRRAKNLKW